MAARNQGEARHIARAGSRRAARTDSNIIGSSGPRTHDSVLLVPGRLLGVG